ncbi:MAG: WhiB family transcriptional regulator [Acidimicrobiales bacterium]
MRRPAWHADALCKEYPGVSWFPEGKGSSPGPAKAICARCVAVECRRAGIEGDESGVWGGLGTRERKASMLGAAGQVAV